jgi:tetratricopeptide (TPR) repeat protein
MIRHLKLAAIAGLVFASPGLIAKQHNHAAYPEQLGSVSFPVSCTGMVQAPFERGVALLHSFEYEEAGKQFREVEQKDPTCAMAYWGEAMTFYHQLWDRPSEGDLKSGWKLVQKAQSLNRKTPRERGYIEAAAAFYRDDKDDKSADYERRSMAYSETLRTLHHRYPNDHEAAVFYALSLLASPRTNDNNLAYRKKAVGVLNAVLSTDPNHPGVAHYLIHACDNPQMAKSGLPAARRYAQIAPASAHALHMPSHIFARLGLWQEDIQSNLASKAAAEKYGMAAMERIHAMQFLEYAYLQTGQDEKAKAVVADATRLRKQDFDGKMADFFYYVQAHFPATLVIETGDWKHAEALQTSPDATPDFQAVTYWARAVAAGHLRDVASARAAVEKFDKALEAVRQSPYAYVADQMATSRDESHAWLNFAEGEDKKAVQLLRPIADRQERIGKGEVELPAREMLAEMLLRMGRPQEALAEYVRSLKADPNRFGGLYGAALSAEIANQPQVAGLYYKRLLANCGDGMGPRRAEIARAKVYIATAGN